MQFWLFWVSDRVEITITNNCISNFRLSRYQQFKDFQKRILVATNLFGRGMDIERVNIVFNYDMPDDSDTYLHRVRQCSTNKG